MKHATTLEISTVIIGASAAGLATAVCLQQKNSPFILLEKEAHVATAWRNHYDRLHLHTDRGNSNLPHLPMPNRYPKYPERAQVVDYLEQYTAHFGLEPRFKQTVTAVKRQEGKWQTETEDSVYLSDNVVVATGYTRVPQLPTWPGQASFPGPILHSSAYKNGRDFVGKQTLVVGFGNSAGEIAVDLCEQGAAGVFMSVRSPVNVVPRDYLGIPILTIGQVMDYIPPKVADLMAVPMIKMSIGDLTKYGLQKLPYGPNVQIRQDGKIPILDIGTVKHIKDGSIKIMPAIEKIQERTVYFSDGREQEFDAIILGTGYKPELNKIIQGVDQTLNDEGSPLQSGVEAAPGLYYCGFYVSPTGMLREIGIEAEKIAADIADKTI